MQSGFRLGFSIESAMQFKNIINKIKFLKKFEFMIEMQVFRSLDSVEKMKSDD